MLYTAKTTRDLIFKADASAEYATLPAGTTVRVMDNRTGTVLASAKGWFATTEASGVSAE